MARVKQKPLTFGQKLGLNVLLANTVIIISYVAIKDLERRAVKMIQDVTAPKPTPISAIR